MVTILGAKWLVGQINSADGKEPIPTDRYAILVIFHTCMAECGVLICYVRGGIDSQFF